MLAASAISFCAASMAAWSTCTSGGARAGAATNSCHSISTCQLSRIPASTDQTLVADKLPGEPQERLLKVVVGLGGDIVVLEVLLAVECNGLCLDLALLHINLVSGKNNRDVLADTDEIAMPVGHVLVGDAGCDVEHDDSALAVDVVSIAKTTKLLLASGVPDIELDLAEVLSPCQ